MGCDKFIQLSNKGSESREMVVADGGQMERHR